MHLINVRNDNKSCENCDSVEDGGHYCLSHTQQIENANIIRCHCSGAGCQQEWANKRADDRVKAGIKELEEFIAANAESHRQTADSIVLCPVCQRGDVWQEAVNRAEYVYKGEAVEDGQEVIDYLLAEVAALLETQNATCEPRGLLRSAQPDCSPHSKIGRIFEAEKALSQAIVEMCEHETELPTSVREKIGHAACLLSNYCVLNGKDHI